MGSLGRAVNTPLSLLQGDTAMHCPQEGPQGHCHLALSPLGDILCLRGAAELPRCCKVCTRVRAPGAGGRSTLAHPATPIPSGGPCLPGSAQVQLRPPRQSSGRQASLDGRHPLWHRCRQVEKGEHVLAGRWRGAACLQVGATGGGSVPPTTATRRGRARPHPGGQSAGARVGLTPLRTPEHLPGPGTAGRESVACPCPARATLWNSDAGRLLEMELLVRPRGQRCPTDTSPSRAERATFQKPCSQRPERRGWWSARGSCPSPGVCLSSSDRPFPKGASTGRLHPDSDFSGGLSLHTCTFRGVGT